MQLQSFGIPADSKKYPVAEDAKWEEVKTSSESFVVRVHRAGQAAASPPSKKSQVFAHGFAAYYSQAFDAPFGNADFIHRSRGWDRVGTPNTQSKAAPTMSSQEIFESLYEDAETWDLLELDPLNWKEQDHYAVLGLGKLRYRATDEDIKRAYRKKALKHHPDKKSESDLTKVDEKSDNFFKCVQRAYELMSEPVKRLQFDSIDPTFDNSIPSESAIETDGFFECMAEVFARNAHFSKKQPVPLLGDLDTPRDEVERFYEFWSSFQSNRSFEMLDEEMPDENDSREERRWMEKQNKAERNRRLKEERARVIKLVDVSMKMDPRILKFRAEDKEKKNAKKNAKKKEAEAARIAEEQRLAAEQQAQEEQAAKEEVARKNRKDFKKILKGYRRDIRNIVDGFKNINFKGDRADVITAVLAFVGEDTGALNKLQCQLEKTKPEQAAFDRFMLLYRQSKGEDISEEERTRFEQMEISGTSETKPAENPVVETADTSVASESSEPSENTKPNGDQPWSEEEIKMLIKAVKMYPAGTRQRWEKVADYIQTHSGSQSVSPRTTNEIIEKSKEVQSSKFIAKAGSLQTSDKKKEVVITDAPSTRGPAAPGIEQSQESRPWTPAEQTQLEAAMKQYPSQGKNAYVAPDRWDKITALVDGRTKKEVLDRVREIVLSLKTKRR